MCFVTNYVLKRSKEMAIELSKIIRMLYDLYT